MIVSNTYIIMYEVFSQRERKEKEMQATGRNPLRREREREGEREIYPKRFTICGFFLCPRADEMDRDMHAGTATE